MAMLPMSPAQAAILGQAPVVGAAGGGMPSPMMGGLPMSPAQAAVLGQAPAPVATSAPMQAMPAAPGMQAIQPFQANPMQALLEQRAMRDEPIRSGIGLVGRLAALGVSQRIGRKDQQREQEYRQQVMAQAMPTIDALPEGPMKQAALMSIATGNMDNLQEILATQAKFGQESQLQGERLTAQRDIAAAGEEGANARAALSANTQAAIAGAKISAAEMAATAKRAHDFELAALKKQMEGPDWSAFNGVVQQYRTGTKDYQEAVPQFSSLMGQLRRGSAADALAATIGFMKILDPGSVVRTEEGEAVQATGGLIGDLAGTLNSVRGKGRLTPEVRADLMGTIAEIMADKTAAYEAQRQQFTDQLLAQGYAPDQIETGIYDYASPLRQALPTLMQELEAGTFGQAQSAGQEGPLPSDVIPAAQAAQMDLRPVGGAPQRGRNR